MLKSIVFVRHVIFGRLLTMHFYYNMTIGDIEKWLHGMGLNFSHTTIMGWFESVADILEPLDEVLQQGILSDTNVHSDETTLKTCDRRLPDKGEREEDVEPEEHYFKRWLFSHYSPIHNLVQSTSSMIGDEEPGKPSRNIWKM